MSTPHLLSLSIQENDTMILRSKDHCSCYGTASEAHNTIINMFSMGVDRWH